jgi:hypothetical protein
LKISGITYTKDPDSGFRRSHSRRNDASYCHSGSVLSRNPEEVWNKKYYKKNGCRIKNFRHDGTYKTGLRLPPE